MAGLNVCVHIVTATRCVSREAEAAMISLSGHGVTLSFQFVFTVHHYHSHGDSDLDCICPNELMFQTIEPLDFIR